MKDSILFTKEMGERTASISAEILNHGKKYLSELICSAIAKVQADADQEAMRELACVLLAGVAYLDDLGGAVDD